MQHLKHELVTRETYSHTTCDGCGQTTHYPIEVTISIHNGEEGGGVNSYDYCDTCLTERADILRTAGSTAPLIAEEHTNE